MEKTFQIYYTSDTHGHIFPVNYASNCPENSGLLNLAAQVEKDGNTLVLDGGDSLQGTPLTQYYLEHRDQWPVHPVAAAFNAMGLDYFTLGNHDFNFGYEALRDYLWAMDGVCLCTNVEDLGGELRIRPWAVHTLANGLRVGLTGVVTDFVNVWEQPQNLEKIRVTDAFQAARATCAALRDQCDVCVCIYHGGFEEELETGRMLSDSGENLACRIARELDFDLLLTGHQHMAVEGVNLSSTYAVQPPANAGQFLHISGKWEGTRSSFRSRLTAVGAIHPAEPYQSLLPLENAVQEWLDQPIGEDALVAYITNARRDTNGIAHALLERFGSFAGVLEASEEELCRVPGVGPASARMLHLLPEVSRYYEHSRTSTEGALTTTERLALT